jgi:hypothetical protein
MTPLLIARIAIDPQLGLVVAPQLALGARYEYIYRAGNGLRWNAEGMGFCAHEPKLWQIGELLCHIVATVAAEFGEDLQLTSRTTWEGVSQSQQAELFHAITSSVGRPASH